MPYQKDMFVRTWILWQDALSGIQETARAHVRSRCIRHWVNWPGLLAVIVGMWMLLVKVETRRAGRHWQEEWNSCGRIHGVIETSSRVTPGLFLADGLHRLSFCPGMDRRLTRGYLLFWLPYSVIWNADVVLQERICVVVMVGVGSIRLVLTVIATTYVVLKLLFQFSLQNWMAASWLCIRLNRPHRWIVLDATQFLNSGFNWYTSVWTHQRSWAVCKVRRQGKAIRMVKISTISWAFWAFLI